MLRAYFDGKKAVRKPVERTDEDNEEGSENEKAVVREKKDPQPEKPKPNNGAAND